LIALDRERGAGDGAGVGAREAIGEQAERDGGEAGAEQRQHLREEQAAVGRIGQGG
jgi:hypothetical protein